MSYENEGPNVEAAIERLGATALQIKVERDIAVKALKASVGYLLNAQIDLETGAPKKTAVATIVGGLRMAREALALIAASEMEQS